MPYFSLACLQGFHDPAGADRIKRGDRLVGQDNLRPLGDGPGNGHPLFLTAGKPVAAAEGLLLDADHLHIFVDLLILLAAVMFEQGGKKGLAMQHAAGDIVKDAEPSRPG